MPSTRHSHVGDAHLMTGDVIARGRSRSQTRRVSKSPARRKLSKSPARKSPGRKSPSRRSSKSPSRVKKTQAEGVTVTETASYSETHSKVSRKAAVLLGDKVDGYVMRSLQTKNQVLSDGNRDMLDGQGSMFGGQGSVFGSQGSVFGGQGSVFGGQGSMLGGQGIMLDGHESMFDTNHKAVDETTVGRMAPTACCRGGVYGGVRRGVTWMKNIVRYDSALVVLMLCVLVVVLSYALEAWHSRYVLWRTRYARSTPHNEARVE